MSFLVGMLVLGLGVFLGLAGWQYARAKTLDALLTLRLEEVKQLQGCLTDTEQTYRLLLQEKAALEATHKSLLEQVAMSQEEAQARQEKISLQFSKLATEILEAKGEKFSIQNQRELNTILQPLKESLKELKQEMTVQQKDAIEKTTSLKQELARVNDLYAKMQEEATNATNAILGNNKSQGAWGELHALQILENAGLKKDEQYFLQQGFADKEGNRLIPDVIIKLPEARTIIMDVKVSLTHYLKYFHASNPKEQEQYLKQHLHSIRLHIKRLSQKNYAQAYNLEGLDFVLMLLPVEPAFALAIQKDPSLFQEAYEKNVVLVSPTSLRSTLSMIHQMWKHTYQSQHALAIAQKSGALYDKFVGFVDDLLKIGSQLEATQKSYLQAKKRLVAGRGNLINRAEELKKLGAKTGKQLPSLGLASEEEWLSSEDESL